ncbi:tyrosine kinase putative [Entamoeba histolytica]|uniref:Tyrosine kinase, putative n=7 Tax=Entamoeba histolytica TaxID=5759 RepID=C4LUB2_ENTH1|nr:tyrosine kinase, putative [Entamoeba histolytica HM-1:IMSS]EAL48877.1 tyrosine kinase, putative [Entamoeba histolytica HM-1:IMSS]GAT92194.1 tyrosine kinase putative [Entamoeba histolytica]|eukprot:XP_654263.1 tyrosine kinase, putative [Entamoeba histolytica HM-1:IMSS]
MNIIIISLICIVYAQHRAWCDTDDNGKLQYIEDPEWKCIYKEENYTYHGFIIASNDKKEIFEVYPDCCSPHEDERQTWRNTFTIIDDYIIKPKELRFVFVGREFKREHTLITIDEKLTGIDWYINTDNIIPRSTITLKGRNEDTELHPYYIEAVTYRFNITSPATNVRETVYLNFTAGFSPFVNISENIQVKLINQSDDIDECQYRYTKSSSVFNMGTDNSNLKVINICSAGIHQRMAICKKDVPDNYIDCSCQYENFEYVNHAMDCTYLSKYYIFKARPLQEFIPHEYLWNSLSTEGVETQLTIPKGKNMTFQGNVVLPSAPLFISGTIYFVGGITIQRTDALYDLGNFFISNINIETNIDESPIFFIGKCAMDPNECDKLFKESRIKEENCGGTKSRFIPYSSNLGCKCVQKGKNTYIQSDCSISSKQRLNRLELVLTGDYESGNDSVYWKSLNINPLNIPPNNSISITGKEIIIEGDCNFTSLNTVQLHSILRCGRLIMSSKTRIVGYNGSELRTYSIDIDGEVNNLNEDALIHMSEGKFSSDSSLVLTLTTTNTKCFELASSFLDLNYGMNGINVTDNEYTLLVLDRIVRVCPKDNLDDEIKCYPTESSLESFKYDQCPCDGEHCFYYMDKLRYKHIMLHNDRSLTGTINADSDLTIGSYGHASILSINATNSITLTLKGDLTFSYISKLCNTFIVDGGKVVVSGNEIQVLVISNKGSSSITFTSKIAFIKLDAKKSIDIKMNDGIVSMQTGRLNDLNGKIVADKTEGCMIGAFSSNSYSCLSCGEGIINGTCVSHVEVENCQSYHTLGHCIECVNGYFLSDKCLPCSSNCNKCINNNQCLQCKDGYKLSDGQCKEETASDCLLYYNNKCVKCEEGKYSIDNINCKGNCGENCVQCYKSDNDKSKCTICEDGFVLFNNECLNSSDVSNSQYFNSIIGNTGVECKSGYVLVDGSCQSCSSYHHDEDCNACDLNQCLSCKNKLLLNGVCTVSSDNCNNITNSKCFLCKEQYYKKENCQECGQGCKVCDETGTCLECINESALLKGGICEDKETIKTQSITENEFDITSEECEIIHYGSCLRCKDGYYASNGICKKCNENCGSCVINSTYCMSCPSGGYVLSENTCYLGNELAVSCKQKTLSKLGCAVCNDGYYKKVSLCFSCPNSMKTCLGPNQAISCKKDYFLYKMQCEAYEDLEHCNTTYEYGCRTCVDGYYVFDSHCMKCRDNCHQCRGEECIICDNDYINSAGVCKYYKTIEHCKAANGIECTKCESNYIVQNGDCKKKSYWYIYMIIGICILFIILIFVVIIAYYYFKKSMKIKQNDIMKIKDLKERDIELVYACDFLITDHPRFEFFDDNQLIVGETREFNQIIGNVGKERIKLQPTVVLNEKIELTVEPKLVILSKGKCVTFHYTIKPLCSTHITESVVINILHFNDNREESLKVDIEGMTNITNILDFDELEIKKKVGEGSFGIVYKGFFRGESVAIKTLKSDSMLDEQLDEFKKEVSMLDKFRSEYIVHFYGAVFIPNKICMVTEYAKYGSLFHLIFKQGMKKLPKEAVRIKICMDAARGIEYLHQNGILHRDIKPDNLLIFSLDKNVPVFAKITDFGSSRNINSMMTNMTFTKGIGTPVYMAPEVLDQSRYKTAADVFSLSVTMFETMKWGPAYPKEQFKYPWQIAQFVSDKKRPSKPDNMRQEIYDIISNGWLDDSRHRSSIETIVQQLGKYNTVYQ